MNKLLMLFGLFFKLGIVNFGGGYALLPLLQREFCEKRGWLTDDEIADYYPIGQCTPGAIAVNVSTFVGYKIKGVLGGIVATLGFIFPALIIITIIASVLTNFSDVAEVQSAFLAIRVCVFVLILSAVIKLAKKSVKDLPALIITLVVLFCSIFISSKYLPLYVYVIVAGVAGIFIGLFKERNKKNIKITDPIEKEVVQEEAVEEVKEEAVEEVKEEKIDLKEASKGIGFYFLGFLNGITLGLLGLPLVFIFKKNKKKFLEGYLSTILLWVILFVLVAMYLISNPNIIFLDVFGQFFRIGICAFGGGLATIPFLKELSEITGWFTIDELANMIAVSESTPGAIGINMSTYVGYEVLSDSFNGNAFIGMLGGMVATLGFVAPSILVILIVSQVLKPFRNAKVVDWAFYGLRAASIGLIGNAAYSILTLSIINPTRAVDSYNAVGVDSFAKFFDGSKEFLVNLFDFKCLSLAIFMGILIFKFKKHPILYIALAAVIGIIFKF